MWPGGLEGAGAGAGREEERGGGGAVRAAETATGDYINHLTEPMPPGCLYLTCSWRTGWIGMRGERWSGEKMKERKKFIGLIRKTQREDELKE